MMTKVARGVAAIAVVAVAMCAGSCGKKGPPLAPFVLIPAPVETITTSRLGNDVFVTLTVPLTNIDASIPVDIGRIEVYGYTGSVAPTPARWAELGTVVATIPIVMPPVDGDGAPLPPAGIRREGAVPGAAVTILDTLEPDELAQGPVAVVDPRRLEFAPLTVPGAALSTVLRRFYVAIPFSQSERPGPPGMQAGLVLTGLPDRPSEVLAEYASAALSLSWEPSGGLLGFLLDRPLAVEPLPFDVVAPPTTVLSQPADASVPPGPTTYNVYRTMAPDPLALPFAPASAPARAPSLGQVPRSTPLNPAPLVTTSTTDDVAFGRPRCYTVRAQRGAVMSGPSQPTCLTPVDVFPPAAPVGIAAVPSEGGISLIWEASTEIDLGGYLVLRQEAGDATLRQLTDLPISAARYRDTSVQPGTRYTYSVVAVDTQLPLPNISTQSAPVEETSR
jgi:hypothetical protein